MKSIIRLAFCSILFFSCSSVTYYPNGANAPLLEAKKDLYLNASIRGMGADLRAAYALTDRIGLQFNVNAINFESTEFENDYHNGQYYAETAAGFYKPLSSVYVLEQYTGIGAGQSFSRNKSTNVLRTTDFVKAYVQFDAGFRWRFFSLGLAAREAFVYTAASRYDGIPEGIEKADLFFEPFIFLGIGPEKFRLNAEAGISLSHFAAISYAPFIFSAGFETRF